MNDKIHYNKKKLKKIKRKKIKEEKKRMHQKGEQLEQGAGGGKHTQAAVFAGQAYGAAEDNGVSWVQTWSWGPALSQAKKV